MKIIAKTPMTLRSSTQMADASGINQTDVWVGTEADINAKFKIVAEQIRTKSSEKEIKSAGIRLVNSNEAELTIVTAIEVWAGEPNSSGIPVGEGVTENGDFQTIEKPLQDAPFWRAEVDSAEESSEREMLMLKAVQVYLDEEDKAEAETKANDFVAGATAQEWFKKMVAKRAAGVQAYFAPAPVLTISEASATMPSGFGSHVAKILANAPTQKVKVPGKKWLGTSDRLSFQNGMFVRERAYTGADFWDTDLYGAEIA